MLESSLTKLQVLKTATLLKRDSNSDFLLWILWIIQKRLFCLEDSWTACSVHLFKNTSRTSPVAASDSFRFPACSSLLKKGLQQRRFSVSFTKLLRTFVPVILRRFWDHLLYRAPLGNCLFPVQITEFQPPDATKIISQVLLKHFIQKRDVAILRRSFT